MYIGLLVPQGRQDERGGTDHDVTQAVDATRPHRIVAFWRKVKGLFS
jgi:hypothetical protein